MAREVLYRRSFHLDRDLKGMESWLEVDRTAVAQKMAANMKISTADGGFEAPRNSLDVPFSGLLEMRRHSEVRNEEIPIGYELSRSLTTRRRTEEFSSFKPLSSTNDQGHLRAICDVVKMKSELDQKPRAPSVVARLMGLDALPRQENLQCSNQSSLRRVLPQEYKTSYDVPALDLGSLPSRASEKDTFGDDPRKEELGNGELSFRNHPQEKQLQEFKREFMARLAVQGRQSLSHSTFKGSTLQQKTEPLHTLESQMDSEEFLDALHFLNANKEFFVKVLNDPHSSFAKHLQQGGGSVPSVEDGPRQMGGKFIRGSFTDDPAERRKKQDMRQCGVNDKARVARGFRWGRDEEMPGRPRWHARGSSTLSGGRTGLDQVVPTRIVVLKPNLSKQVNRKFSIPSSPLIRLDGILKSRTEGKENVKQDAKERLHLRKDVGITREFFRDDINKDASKDPRVIAKQIVKHVKDDMSQRVFKEGPRTVDLLAPMSCSTGRKASAQRVSGVPGDTSALNDREGHYRTSKDNGKISLSLPSSPRLSKFDRESEHRQFGLNGRRGSHIDDIKRTSHMHGASSMKSSREPSKVDEGTQGGHDSCTKQNGIRDSKSLKKTCRSNSLKVRDLKCEAPRVLPRSLSAPASASVENRAFESESKGVERASCPSKARPAESSHFKERLLSLKDSFSLTKKRGTKKLSPPMCSSSLDPSELSTRRQLGVEKVGALSVDEKASCHLLPGGDWQAASATKDEEDKEVSEKSVDEMLCDISPTTSGLHQWTSMADLADSASETSLDKCEQPSPVSVLETPFLEENPNSVDTRDTDSKCHELRRGLSRLESADYKELPRNLHAAFFSQPSSLHSSFDSSADESLNAWNLPEAYLESFGLCDVACTSGSEEELTYIMHVLSLSGLNMNGLIMAHSLSSEHGLNPSIFGKLEAYYGNSSTRCTSAGRDNGHPPLNLSSRRLLFDVVNEVVASISKKRLLQPLSMSSNQKVLLCTGKQLLEEIFSHISYHRFVPSETEEEALEDMASKDLMREAPWVHSQSDMQCVVIDIERLLCGDLIRELVHECVSS